MNDFHQEDSENVLLLYQYNWKRWYLRLSQQLSKGSKLSTEKAFWRDVHAWETIKTPRSLSKAPIVTQLPGDYTLQKRPAEKCQPFLEKSVYYLGSRGRKSSNKKFTAERLTI